MHDADAAPHVTAHETRGVALFFVATFVITWGVQLPALLVHEGVLSGPIERFMPLLGLGAFGPMLGAIVAARLVDGRGGVRALFSRFTVRGVAPLFFVLAPFVSGAIFVVGRALYGLFADDGGPFFYPPRLPEQWVALVVFSLGEEIGWRGFALPRLVERRGPLMASAVVGVLWGAWHLPMMRMQGVDDPVTLALLVPFFVFGSVVFTWWTMRAGWSLVVAFLFHTGAHLNNPHQVLATTNVPLVIHTVAYAVVALALVVVARELRPARAV